LITGVACTEFMMLSVSLSSFKLSFAHHGVLVCSLLCSTEFVSWQNFPRDCGTLLWQKAGSLAGRFLHCLVQFARSWLCSDVRL